MDSAYIQGMADDSGIYADECNYDPGGHLNMPDQRSPLTHVAPLPFEKGPAMPTPPKPAEVLDAPVKNDPPSTPEKPKNEVAHWKDRMVALTKQTQVAEKPAGGFISFKGGRMTYQDELVPGDKLRCVIIDYRKDNEFYDKPYDPKVAAIPACYAIVRPHEIQTPWRMPFKDENIEGLIRQDPYVTEAQDPQIRSVNDEGELNTCEDCPMFQWGSDLKGGKGKACKTSRRLHVFAADDCDTPENIGRASYMTMIPPATSTENFQKCANQIVNVLNTPIFGAVVEISVAPHDRFLYMVSYKLIEQIKDEDRLMALLRRHEQISAKPINMPKPDEDDAAKSQRGAAPAANRKF